MPFEPLLASTVANTSASLDTEPFEIHILRPFRIQSFPSRFAVACRRVASLPTAGSVRPKQAMTSPLHRRGGPVRFFSSLTPFRVGGSDREVLAPCVVADDESWLALSFAG